MATNMNRLMALALMPQREPSVKFDPSRTEATTDAEQELAKIIGEETEREREAQRGEDGKVARGLLGDEVDYVDTVMWDDFLQRHKVLGRCSQRANLPPTAVLHFVVNKCVPSNWSALFWMHAFFEQLDASTAIETDDAFRRAHAFLEKRQAEVNRAKAVAAAEARHNKPGGTRSKRDSIRAAWATGNFKSRDDCVEQEAAAIGISPSAARRALRNRPNPT